MAAVMAAFGKQFNENIKLSGLVNMFNQFEPNMGHLSHYHHHLGLHGGFFAPNDEQNLEERHPSQSFNDSESSFSNQDAEQESNTNVKPVYESADSRSVNESKEASDLGLEKDLAEKSEEKETEI